MKLKTKTTTVTVLCALFGLIIFLKAPWKKEEEGFYGRTNRDYWNNCPRLRGSVYGYRVVRTVQNLIPMEVQGKEDLIRVGDQKSDGGYVLLDNLSNISCVYSIGIGLDWTFDVDMASRGIFVYMFDPFFLDAKQALSDNSFIKFYAYGIKGEKDDQVLISSHFKGENNLITLESMLKLDDNLNKSEMILKMDVEGWEWDVLSSVSSSILNRFSQIVLELHWFDRVVRDEKSFSTLLSSFENLNKTHQLVWVNGHNGDDMCVLGGVPIPLCIEVTFVRRDKNLIFQKYDNKRKRFDARNDRNQGKLLLWWIESSEQTDLEFLANTYKSEML